MGDRVINCVVGLRDGVINWVVESLLGDGVIGWAVRSLIG